ncbi:MAG TPA: GNAT family N-acetyltransferase [Phycisphaerales bacterium]|nr:GNAT family N-acetyltransferase [Phycisphaerales bacterium]
MIQLIDLARLEDARFAHGVGDVAAEARWLASGGRMTAGAPRAWTNTSVGLGLGISPDPDVACRLGRGATHKSITPVPQSEVDELIEWFESRGNEPRLEASSCAHPSLFAALSLRGFVLRLVENLLFCDLTGSTTIPFVEVPGIQIITVDPANDLQVQEYAHAVCVGFRTASLPAGSTVPEGLDIPQREIDLTIACVRHPRTTCLAAVNDAGRIVGGGVVETFGDIGGMFALSVLPPYRRRGIQCALMAARVAHARKVGIKVVTVSSLPGVGTERNARRAGFQVGYTRLVMVRPGERLETVDMGDI